MLLPARRSAAALTHVNSRTVASTASPGVHRRIRPGVDPSPSAASTTTTSGAPVHASRIAAGLADRRHHPYAGEVALGDLVGHGEPDAVVTAVTVADTDDQARSSALDCQRQEVRRARDARVVVANRLLAQRRQRRVVQRQVRGDQLGHFVLDGGLVLCGGRHDRRGPDQAVVADLVAVVQQPARRLADAVADAGAGRRRRRTGARAARIRR